MAALPPDHVFVYPDPSLLGLKFTPPQFPPQQFSLSQAVCFPGPNAPAPAPIVAAPVPPPTPIAGLVPAPPLSAAGLQPFPALTPGLQAPTELNAAQTQDWNTYLRVSYDFSGMGLRNGRQDTCKRSMGSRQSRARKKLKILWEAAGGAPYISNQ